MFSQSNFLRADQQQRYQSQVLSPAAKRLSPHQGSHTANGLSQPALRGWQRLTSLWQQFFQRLAQRSQISIEERINAKGEAYWYISDPHSGRSFYAETLNEAIHWIEVQHFGK